MDTVIYHASCWDGFCSAWLAHMVWPNAEYIPANYGWDVPDVTGKNVIIVDFSYPRDVLLDMKAKAASLIVLDHHKTAQKDLEGLDFCTFDMNKSGARLIHDYISTQSGVLAVADLLVDYIEDRDLWRKALPDSEAINAAIRSYPLDFKVWDYLAIKEHDELANEGHAILRYQQSVIDHHLNHLQIVEIDGVKGKGCACTIAHLWSEIAHAIMEKEDVPLTVIWCDTDNGTRIYSLRSKKGGLDVGEMAKRHGGGGHPSASGFIISTSITLNDQNSPIHTKIERAGEPAPTA